MTNPLTVAVTEAVHAWVREDLPTGAQMNIGFHAPKLIERLATLKTAQEGEGGPDAYQIIAEANRRSMMMRGGGRDTSRDPLLGPPDDMAVSRVLLAERPDFDPKEADRLAVKIADALRATKIAQEEQAPSRPSQDLKAAVERVKARLGSHSLGGYKIAEKDAADLALILSALNAPGSGGEEEGGRSGAESVQEGTDSLPDISAARSGKSMGQKLYEAHSDYDESWAQPAFNTAAQAIRDLVRERDEARNLVRAASWLVKQRRSESEALCLRLREALEPFANWAADNVDADPFDEGCGVWSGNRCERERIVDWFGPTDFFRARQALSSGTGDREEGGSASTGLPCAQERTQASGQAGGGEP